MATDSERLVLEMSADLRRFQNSLDRANRAADRRFNALEKRATKAGANVERSFSGMGSRVRQALATIGVGLAVREVGQYADAWQNASNRLLFAGVAQSALADTQDRVVNIAKETRTELKATNELYARLTQSSRNLGATQGQVARAVETVNKALAGASQSERASAIQQLGQGLQSSVLQGEELKAILEASQPLSQAIADEFGVAIGDLKRLGSEGKLTSARVFAAIIKGSASVDAQFAKTRGTIAESFTTLQTEATRFIGRLDQATGSSAALAGFIVHVANNLDLLAQAAVIAGAAVGGALLGRGIVGLLAGLPKTAVGAQLTATALQTMGVRAAAAGASMTALRGAMAFLGGPWGVAITAIAVAVAYYATQAGKAKQPTEDFTKASDALTKSLGEYEDAAVKASVATGKEAAATRAAAAEKRKAVEANLRATRAKLAEADATLRLLDAEEKRLESRVMNNPASFGAEDPFSGMAAAGVEVSKKFTKAAANRKLALADIAASEKKLKEIETTLNGPGIASSGAAAGGSGGSSKGGRTVKELEAEVALEAARLAENVDLTRELEAQAFIAAQTRDYQDAGLTAAKARAKATRDSATLEDAKATAQARELATLRDSAELEINRIDADEAGVRSLERRLELQDRIRDLQDAGLDLATATATATENQMRADAARTRSRERWLEISRQEHALTVASLGGDQERARLLERELFIRERILELQSQGGLNPSDAAAQATQEANDLAAADLRGKFRAAFRDGVRGAIEGDLGQVVQGFVADIADKVLGTSLDTLADGLLETLATAFPELLGQLSGDTLGAAAAGGTIATAITTAGVSAGATLGTAIATSAVTGSTAIAGSITSSGVITAATIGNAIVAAGAIAAGQMAAAVAGASAASAGASVASAFAGFRASGGPARFITNERGPEGFARTAPGVVFSTAAMRGLADLGRQAKEGRIGGGGDMRVTIENRTGVEAQGRAERTSDGMKVTLEPIAKKMIEGAGKSGLLQKSLRQSPQRLMRG